MGQRGGQRGGQREGQRGGQREGQRGGQRVGQREGQREGQRVGLYRQLLQYPCLEVHQKPQGKVSIPIARDLMAHRASAFV